VPRLLLLTSVLVVAVSLSACASGDVAETGPDPAVTATPAPAPTEDPTEEETVGEDRSATGGTTITGRLGGDAQLEGGCAWVETKDGTRYEVQYPEGYEVARDGSQLRGPDGDVIATAGDEITLTGAVAEDAMSFCQIGPIFAADEVRT
jgi:hypothetical protein